MQIAPEINIQSISPRTWKRGVLRGAAGRCPNCGAGAIFSGFLTVQEACTSCGHELGAYRADDAPPYVTIFIVGHIIVTAMMLLDGITRLPLWGQIVIWLPATLFLTIALMRPVKGAVIGEMWANKMN